jgi:tetratricopeptide (TPR) repeat protein
LIASIAVILLLLGGPTGMRMIKGWQARRLADQAREQMDQQEWIKAAKTAQAAFQLRPAEPEVWRALARLLSRTGRGPAAMGWWQKIEQVRPLTLDDRRDFATAAISANELTRAAEQIEAIRAVSGENSTQDLLLSGGLAATRGYNTEALKYAGIVLSKSSSDSSEYLRAAILMFKVTRPDSPENMEAANRLVDLARNSRYSTSLPALIFLVQQAGLARENDSPSPPIVQLNGPASPIPWSEVADLLDNHPKAQPYHRILALKIRAQHEPAQADQFLVRAIELSRHADEEALVTLVDWLAARGEFEKILSILPLERAAPRRALLMSHIEALGALGRYAEVREILLTELSALDQTVQHMVLAMARLKLGETVAADNEWQRAMDFADTTEKLLALAAYAELNKAFDVADAANLRALQRQPKLRPAYLSRLRLAESRGQTAKACDIANEMVQLWPEDTAARVRAIYLRLLLDPSASVAKEAEEEATSLLSLNPLDFAAQTTLALAQLRQGRGAAALASAPQPRPNIPASPVLAAAWAANGWKDEARKELSRLATTRLLPEERELLEVVTSDE